MVPFMALVVPWCLLWSRTCNGTPRGLKYRCHAQDSNPKPPTTSRSSPQSSNQHPVLLLVFLAKVSEVFHPLQIISALEIGFPPRFVIEFKRFMIDRISDFSFLLFHQV